MMVPSQGRTKSTSVSTRRVWVKSAKNPYSWFQGDEMSAAQTPTSGPWWKFGYVWLVISGPAIVVVAGFFTLYLAISRPDPVYADPAPGVQRTVTRADAHLAPAIQARNHAATGGAGAGKP